jgi:hypothetical protein
VIVGKEPSMAAAQQLASALAADDRRVFVVRLDSMADKNSAVGGKAGINRPSSSINPVPQR